MHHQDRLVLLTNDDGVRAEGLLALKEALSGWGRVFVVAPAEENSAVSQALTIHRPLRTFKVAGDHYALTGTPADCVIFALRKLLPRLPDLVVSGINHGPNLGDDIIYSGTVAGAREAVLHRIPAAAASSVGSQGEFNFGPVAGFVRRIIDELFPFPEGTFLNINIPEGNPVAYRFTRQGSKAAQGSIEEKRDPRGRSYYWIARDESEWMVEADTDYEAIRAGEVSVTPLQRDQTDYSSLASYKKHRGESCLNRGG